MLLARSAGVFVAAIFAIGACAGPQSTSPGVAPSAGVPATAPVTTTSQQPSSERSPASATVLPTASTQPPAPTQPPGSDVVEVTVGTDTGIAVLFDPVEVMAPAAAEVALTFENRSINVPHNLTFGDPINVATATTVQPGASETVAFTAPEAGEYEFVCTLHPGMSGTLVVQ